MALKLDPKKSKARATISGQDNPWNQSEECQKAESEEEKILSLNCYPSDFQQEVAEETSAATDLKQISQLCVYFSKSRTNWKRHYTVS